MDTEIDARDNNWHAEVTENLLIAPIGSLTIILKQPVIKKATPGTPSIYANNEMKALEYTYKKDSKAKKALMEMNPKKINVTIMTSLLTTSRQMSLFQKLQCDVKPLAKKWRTILTGTLSAKAELEDLFKAIPSKCIKKALTELQLTASQALGIKHLCLLPNGLGLFTGLPETSKLHFIAQSIIPILRCTGEKILLVTPSNNPVNNLAAMVQNILTTQGMNNKMVIRLHAKSMKLDIFGKKVQEDTVNKPKLYLIVEEGTTVERESLFIFKTALFIKAFYEQAMEKPNNL